MGKQNNRNLKLQKHRDGDKNLTSAKNINKKIVKREIRKAKQIHRENSVKKKKGTMRRPKNILL